MSISKKYYEIIAINDLAKDNSPKIAKEILNNKKNCRLLKVKKKTVGAGYARNYGLKNLWKSLRLVAGKRCNNVGVAVSGGPLEMHESQNVTSRPPGGGRHYKHRTCPVRTAKGNFNLMKS